MQLTLNAVLIAVLASSVDDDVYDDLRATCAGNSEALDILDRCTSVYDRKMRQRFYLDKSALHECSMLYL